MNNYSTDFVIILKKDDKFYLYRGEEWDDIKDQYVEEPFAMSEADEIYYREFDDIHTAEDVENDIIMNDSVWANEDWTLDNAIEDVLSGRNMYEWPDIDIDFIYNGKVFFSFTL